MPTIPRTSHDIEAEIEEKLRLKEIEHNASNTTAYRTSGSMGRDKTHLRLTIGNAPTTRAELEELLADALACELTPNPVLLPAFLAEVLAARFGLS